MPFYDEAQKKYSKYVWPMMYMYNGASGLVASVSCFCAHVHSLRSNLRNRYERVKQCRNNERFATFPLHILQRRFSIHSAAPLLLQVLLYHLERLLRH